MEKIFNSQIVSYYKATGLLNLSGLGLKTIPGEIHTFRGVKKIALSNNMLQDITILSHFPDLEVLFLQGNNIRNLKPLEHLKNLKILNLDNNLIEDITPLKDLQNLDRLFLRNNNISELSEFIIYSKLHFEWNTSESYYSGVYLAGNPIAFPPMEIVKQGKIAMQTYFSSIKESSQPLNEVKVIIVGDGAAGKTSLLRRLLNREFNPNETQTHGIKIERNEIIKNGESIKVNFWDFGGQEIMHATHQFFLSYRCIYLLVLDSRKDETAEYWLKHIATFGGDSSVYIILNKIDENPAFEVDRSFLLEKYPNILAFHRVSCASNDGIEIFKKELEESIYNSEMRKTPFSKNWFDIKEAVGNLKMDYISYQTFTEICNDNFVKVERQRVTLLGFLHDLGVLLHFDSLKYYDTNVMNPTWLTNGVYRIINSPKIVENLGVINISEIEEIVNDNTRYGTEIFHYPTEKCFFLMKIMEKFELCFAVNADLFILPELLPIRRHERPFDINKSYILFNILYSKFLPNSIFPRLMVQLHHLIKENCKWRTGMILEDKQTFNSLAYVYIDKDAMKIVIEVVGKKDREFLLFIRRTIQDINESYSKLECTEMIWIENLRGYSVPVDFKELLGFEGGLQKTYYSGILQEEFVVKEILDIYEPLEFRQNKGKKPVKIFISYSHVDEKYKNELKKALSPLWRLDKIKLWDDRSIDIGSLWEEEIYYNLLHSDIVILLITPDFISSDFCYSNELKLAYKEYEEGRKLLIPIRLRSVNYDTLAIGKIQGIPENWIVTDYSVDLRDKMWTEISKKIEEIIS